MAAIYINGTQVKQGAYVIPANVFYDDNHFGSYWTEGNASSPNAYFDDLMIFNRALVLSEIQQVIFKTYF